MKSETKQEILKQWQAVQEDRARRQQCLDHTGPGDLPYTQAQDTAWEMREHCLSKTLLSAMPELEEVLNQDEIENCTAEKIGNLESEIVFYRKSLGRVADLFGISQIELICVAEKGENYVDALIKSIKTRIESK